MLLERLESRELLASDFHNTVLPLDVSGDGVVSPLDALQVINDLNANGSRELQPPAGEVESFIDTNGDCNLSPIDALLIINALNGDREGPVPTVALQNDTGTGGIPNTDLRTSDGTLVGSVNDLTGIATLEAEVADGGKTDVPFDSAGNFTFTPVLADGVHTVTLTATDGVGNEGSTQFTFTIDTTPPVLDGFGLTPETDTGVSNTDNVTMLTSATLTADTESGATVTLLEAGQVIDTQVANSPVFFSLTGLVDGSRSFRAIAEDIVGNVGDPVDVTIVVDTVAPTLSTEAPTENATVHGGTRLIGTIANGGDSPRVTYQIGNGPSNIIAVDGTGRFDDTMVLTGVTGGAQELVVTGSDQAGNAASETINVNVDVGFDSVFINPDGGSYGTASNWSGGILPTAAARVLLPFENVDVTLPAGSTVAFEELVNRSNLIARGVTTLEGNILNDATGTFEVRGDDPNRDATITVAGNLTNRGTIELTAFPGSAGDNTGDDATLVISDGTLINETTGVIKTVAPSINGRDNARRIRGNVANRGTIEASHTTGFDQSGTTLSNFGAINVLAGDLNVINSTLSQDGGTFAGQIDLATSGILTLNADTMVADSTTLFVRGGSQIGGNGMLTVANGGTLDVRDGTIGVQLTNAGRLLTRTGSAVANAVIVNEATGLLEVRGDDSFVDATFRVNANLTNRGTIELEAFPGFSGDTTGDDATLIVTNGTLTNEAGGTIKTLGSSINGRDNRRQIRGDVNNQGTIEVDQTLGFNATGRTLTNSGTLQINSGQIDIVNTTLIQASGTLAGPGDLDLQDNGRLVLNTDLTIPDTLTTFVRNSSQINGTGTLTIARGGQIDLRAGAIGVAVTNRGDFVARTGTALANAAIVNESTGLLEIRGDDEFGDATFRVNANLTNRGTIELEAAPQSGIDPSGDDATLVVVNGAVTNEAGGVIKSLAPTVNGPENRRQIVGNLNNLGMIEVDQTLSFNDPGKTLTNSGTLQIDAGQLKVIDTTLRQNSGTLAGPGDIDLEDNGTLTLDTDLTVPSSLTMLVRGQSQINGSGSLTVADGGQLDLRDGTIGVPVTNQGGFLARTSMAAVNALLVNESTGVLEIRGDETFGDATVTVNGAITNRGTIEVEAEPSTGDNALGDDSVLIVGETLTNELGGTIKSLPPAISGATSDRKIRGELTNQGALDIDHTLAFDDPGSTLTNSGMLRINSGQLLIVDTVLRHNAGTVSGPGDVDLASNGRLRLDTDLTIPQDVTTFVRNNSQISGAGSLTIANGGQLDLRDGTLQVPVTNQGGMLVRTNSAVANGPIVNDTGGLLKVRGDAGHGDAMFAVNAMLTNRGTIELEAEPGSVGDAIGDGVTLAVANATLLNEAGGTIKSLPSVTNGAANERRLHADINNAGIIEVDQTISFNQLNRTLTNAGEIRINTGSLDVINAKVVQQDGTIAGPGDLDFDITGTLTLNTDLLVPDTVTLLLRNGSEVDGAGTLTIQSGGKLDLQDATVNTPVTNHGSFLVRTNTAVAGGPIVNESGGLLEVRGDDTFQDATFTVNAALTNRGTIELEAFPGFVNDPTGDDATLVVANAAFTNEAGGTIKSLPPGLPGRDNARRIQANLMNAGTIQVEHTVSFNASGTTLTHSGDLAINSGQFNVIDTTFFQDGGTLSGSGDLDLETNATLTLNSDLHVTNGVTLLVRGSSEADGPGELAVDVGGAIELSNGTLGVTVTNSGSILAQGPTAVANANITNESQGLLEIRADGSFGDTTLTVNADLTNHGRIDFEAMPAGFGSPTGDDVALVVAGTLLNETAGRIFSFVPDTPGDANRRTVTAIVDNRGLITATQALTFDRENATHTNSGTIEGGTVTISGMGITTFSSSGTLTVPAGHTFSTPAFTLAGGTTTVDGTLTSTAGLALTGGTLAGSGRVIGNVTNSAATVSPGSSAGTLRINGSYTQEAGGSLAIEIGGAVAGQDFDVLAVTGVATLDGSLDLAIINDFEPVESQSFRTLTAGFVNGTFETVTGTAAPNNLQLLTNYNASNVTIDVAQTLRLAGTPGAGSAAITLDDVHLLKNAAISLWIAAGISDELTSSLDRVEFRVVDLEGDLLGLAHDNVVLLDLDAAGWGWFVDDTPETSDDVATHQVDLLTAITHELGHVLGLADNLDPLAKDIMAVRLGLGERRNPTPRDVDSIMAQPAE